LCGKKAIFFAFGAKKVFAKKESFAIYLTKIQNIEGRNQNDK